MSLDLILIIAIILGALFIAILFGFIFTKLVKSMIGIFVTAFLLVASVAVMIFTVISFRDLITSDYRDCDTIATYQMFDMTSIDSDTTLINYVDENKELKHIKSDKVKIFYDLNDDHDPFVRKVKYWRWFIYWYEVEVHIKE